MYKPKEYQCIYEEKSTVIKRISFVRNYFEVRYNNSPNHVQVLRYYDIGDGIICSLSTKVDEEENGEQKKEEIEDE